MRNIWHHVLFFKNALLDLFIYIIFFFETSDIDIIFKNTNTNLAIVR